MLSAGEVSVESGLVEEEEEGGGGGLRADSPASFGGCGERGLEFAFDTAADEELVVVVVFVSSSEVIRMVARPARFLSTADCFARYWSNRLVTVGRRVDEADAEAEDAAAAAAVRGVAGVDMVGEMVFA